MSYDTQASPILETSTILQPPPYADIFTISFPCTGISVAGKGRGLADPNSGLWFEAERIIRVGRPKYCIIENGPALTIRGLDRILYFFASIGYDAEWTCLQGWQFGVQQRRKRLFLVAYPRQSGFQGEQHETAVFRQFKAGIRIHLDAVYPGWAGRWDIPEPRTYGSAYDIPGGVHRLVCTGDAIIPLVGMYVLECIKRHCNKHNI